VLALQPDGLNIVRLGDPYDVALPQLTARLGAPDDPGRLGGRTTGCVVAHRWVRWGDLQLLFTDIGVGGLRLSMFMWGDRANLNSGTAHAAPTGPGTPQLRNPWNVNVGTLIPDAARFASDVARYYPGATVTSLPPILDPSVAQLTPTRTLNIALHPVPGGHVVERIWVFDPREISGTNCPPPPAP
jgi:hypothetical protein